MFSQTEGASLRIVHFASAFQRQLIPFAITIPRSFPRAASRFPMLVWCKGLLGVPRNSKVSPACADLHKARIVYSRSATVSSCKGFRRVRRINLVTTFTSSKRPSLINFSAIRCRCRLPKANPKTSLSRSIGSSDGRCVQRAGT